MARRLVKGIIGFLVAAVLLFLAAGAYVYYLNSPSPQIPAEGYVFKVLRGENLSGISERLDREGLIRSQLSLILFSRLNQTETAFQNGYFRILPGDSMIDVHNLLVSGYQEQVKITIPEGWTLKKIAGYIEESGIAGSEEFLEAASSSSLLDQFGIPAENLDKASSFAKFGRRKALALAVVNVAASVELDAVGERFVRVAIALGAVAPTTIRARKAEAFLSGRRVREGALDEASRIAATEISPIDDFRASARYRRDLVKVLARRVLQEALRNARSG